MDHSSISKYLAYDKYIGGSQSQSPLGEKKTLISLEKQKSLTESVGRRTLSHDKLLSDFWHLAMRVATKNKNVTEKDIEEFRALVESGKARGFLNLKYENKNQRTLFQLVIMRNSVDPRYIEIMIDAGVDLSIQDADGNTPLMWAIANANYGNAWELLRLTEEKGINCSYINLADNGRLYFKNTALHLVVAKGYLDQSGESNVPDLPCTSLDLAKKLCSLGANVNCQNVDGNTPLHFACMHRDYAMIRYLLSQGADPSIRNLQGHTAKELLNIDDKVIEEELSRFIGRGIFRWAPDDKESCRDLFKT